MKGFCLFFVRHGKTALTGPPDRFCGRSDPPLTAAGRAEVETVANSIAGKVAISKVYSSRMLRAVQTAEIVSQTLQVPLELDDGIREADFGCWEGLTKEEVASRFPDEYSAWAQPGSVIPPPAGTTVDEMAVRALTFAAKLQNQEEDVLVVSHKTFLRVALCAWLGVGLQHHRSICEILPCGLGCVRHSGPAARMVLLNWFPPGNIREIVECA